MSFKTAFEGNDLALELWKFTLKRYQGKADSVPLERSELIMYQCLEKDGEPLDRMPNKTQRAELEKLGFPADVLSTVKYCIATKSSVGMFEHNPKLKTAIDNFIEFSTKKKAATKKPAPTGAWSKPAESANINTGKMRAGGTAVSVQSITKNGVTQTVRTETRDGVTTTTIIERDSNGVEKVVQGGNSAEGVQPFPEPQGILSDEDEESIRRCYALNHNRGTIDNDAVVIQSSNTVYGGQGNIGNNNSIGVMQTFSGINTGGADFSPTAHQSVFRQSFW